jgi:hypothetical protein
MPVVVIKNKPTPRDFFSISDAEMIMKLNKMYNEEGQMIKSITDYYSAPITVITGANAKNLKRGLGQIWTGLPEGASVSNLNMDADLSAMMLFMDRIKTNMHEVGEIPEQSLGQLQAVSGTNEDALELQYQPLIQLCDVKTIQYGEGFNKMHNLTLKIMRTHDDSLSKTLTDEVLDSYEIETRFTYGFPKNMSEKVDLAAKEIMNGFDTRKNVLERLGKTGVDELIKEIKEEAKEFAEIAALLRPSGNKETDKEGSDGNTDKNTDPNSDPKPPTNNQN